MGLRIGLLFKSLQRVALHNELPGEIFLPNWIKNDHQNATNKFFIKTSHTLI